jgi:NTP pyrophosphatase (non-canonical NTP hydrolase)
MEHNCGCGTECPNCPRSASPVIEYFAPLNDYRDLVWAVSSSKGFKDEPVTVATMTSNLTGEVSELWEAYRAGKLNEPCDKAEKMLKLGLPALTCAEEEVADVIIRALDTAKDLGIDVARAVSVKHEFNKARPHRNGGKLA